MQVLLGFKQNFSSKTYSDHTLQVVLPTVMRALPLVCSLALFFLELYVSTFDIYQESTYSMNWKLGWQRKLQLLRIITHYPVHYL